LSQDDHDEHEQLKITVALTKITMKTSKQFI